MLKYIIIKIDLIVLNIIIGKNNFILMHKK